MGSAVPPGARSAADTIDMQIIATLGPSEFYKEGEEGVTAEMVGKPSFEKVEALYLAGVRFFRLNFSHGTHEGHKAFYDIIHEVRVKHSADIGVIGDMQGPKLRIGTFEKKAGKAEINLRPGMEIVFDQDETPGNETRVNLPHPEIIEAVQPGQRLLINDGNVVMEIVSKSEKTAKAVSRLRLYRAINFLTTKVYLRLVLFSISQPLLMTTESTWNSLLASASTTSPSASVRPRKTPSMQKH